MKKLISMLFMAVLAVLTMTGCDDEETVLQKYTVTFNSQGGSEVPLTHKEEVKLPHKLYTQVKKS